MSIAVSMETYDDECGCWATEVSCDLCGGWIRDIRGSPQTPPPDICPDCVENRIGEVEELIAHWHDAVIEPIFQGYSAHVTDAEAHTAFVAKFGRQPKEIWRTGGGVNVGPLRREEIR